MHRGSDAPQRFGGLNMAAALGQFMMHHPEIKTKMQDFVTEFVVPELSSSEPYMRAIVRICTDCYHCHPAEGL
jgi:hypothetical protein